MKYYTINQFAKIIGVSQQTLRNWDNNGKLKPHHVSPSGYRYYLEDQINEFKGIKTITNENKLDEIYLNTILNVSSLYYTNVSEDTKNIIDKIKELIGGE